MAEIIEQTIIKLDLAWAATGDDRIQEVTLPQGVTDYVITEYDSSEGLYYVKDGKLYNADHERCGDRK